MDANVLSLTDSYWDSLKNLSDKVKLALISRLSESIAVKDTAKTDDDSALERLAGTWEDDLTSDEMIEFLKESRTFHDKRQYFE